MCRSRIITQSLPTRRLFLRERPSAALAVAATTEWSATGPLTRQLPSPRRFFSVGGIGVTSAREEEADVLVVGGGPVGLSTAFHLSRIRGGGDGRGIVVLERDPTYRRASATLSAGGIRQQFSLTENVKMSMYGRDFLRDAEHGLGLAGADGGGGVQFQENGYLFLASSESGAEVMRRNHAAQREAGCADVRLMDRNELADRFPWLNTSDVVLGSFGERGEGWFDPWSFISALKAITVEMDVKYVHGTPIDATRDRATGAVLSVNVKEFSKRGEDVATYDVGQVVNAGGAHASAIMDVLAGPDAPLVHPLPVRPRKRCIFFFHCSAATEGLLMPPADSPLTIDSSLCYFRPEGSLSSSGGTGGGGSFLCGASPADGEDDPDCHDEASLDYADHGLFEERIWPALFHRVPAFGEIKVRSSWAGLYDYNAIDENAVVGFHPEMPNVLMVNGFSGHGLQHSPAAGRAAAELLEHGAFRTLDLGIFSFERFARGEAIFEQGIV